MCETKQTKYPMRVVSGVCLRLWKEKRNNTKYAAWAGAMHASCNFNCSNTTRNIWKTHKTRKTKRNERKGKKKQTQNNTHASLRFSARSLRVHPYIFEYGHAVRTGVHFFFIIIFVFVFVFALFFSSSSSPVENMKPSKNRSKYTSPSSLSRLCTTTTFSFFFFACAK